jgi:hypothetical protein
VSSTNALGVEHVWGLAYLSDQLYGLTGNIGDTKGELVTIDVTTGIATRVRDLSFDAGGAASARP